MRSNHGKWYRLELLLCSQNENMSDWVPIFATVKDYSQTTKESCKETTILHKQAEQQQQLSSKDKSNIQLWKTKMEYSPTTQKYHQQGPPSQPPLEQPQNKGPTRRKWLRLRVPEKHIQKQAKFNMNIQTELHEPKISKINKLCTSYINNAYELHQPNKCKCCWTLL